MSLKINFLKEKPQILIIDQTKLPFQTNWIDITDPENALDAILNLKVRGAPLIGVAAGLSLAAYSILVTDRSKRILWWQKLISSRPTAVNLIHVLNDLKILIDKDVAGEVLWTRALDLYEDDKNKCLKISNYGSNYILNAILNSKDIIAANSYKDAHTSPDKKKSLKILTHCNTGELATSGVGTALGVIKDLHQKTDVFVYADETRPLLQGARLTSWELKKNNIKFNLICDSMAGFLMQQKKVDLVIVGADRITSQGDTANKIGTYNLAVLCHYHKIPFYVAAPTTTIDSKIKTGSEIPIEERHPSEILGFGSGVNRTEFAEADTLVYNPAFDWVPANLISAWITEHGVFNNKDIENGAFLNLNL